MSRPSLAKRWCFTLNNYSDVEFTEAKAWVSANCSYGIIGEEVGENQTPHLQGFIILERKRRLSQLKAEFSQRAHFELARGTPDDNRQYCSKEQRSWETGVCPNGAGRHKSRDELAREFDAAIGAGAGGLDGFKDDNPGAYAFSRHTLLRNYLGHARPCDRPNVRCEWFYGAPGVGKSRLAHERLPSAFIKEPCTKWWTGYMLETTCIIDDFGPKGISLNHLLRWFDRYKCYVETKGDIVPLHVDEWIVTSNFHPREVYKLDSGEDHPQIDALLRRITVTHFTGIHNGLGT